MEEEYRQKILNYDFVNDLQYVKKGKSRLEIKVKSGGQLIDLGDRVVANRMDDRKAAEHISTLAAAKGWNRVSLTGSETFKAQAWLELKKRGIEVVGYEPPQKVKEKWDAMQLEGNITPVSETQISEDVTNWRNNRIPSLKPEMEGESKYKPKP